MVKKCNSVIFYFFNLKCVLLLVMLVERLKMYSTAE